jgi:hypothetical protein
MVLREQRDGVALIQVNNPPVNTQGQRDFTDDPQRARLSLAAPLPERLPLSLRVEFKSEREALKAGNSPKRMPVRNETAKGTPSTRQSMPMAEPSSPMRAGRRD